MSRYRNCLNLLTSFLAFMASVAILGLVGSGWAIADDCGKLNREVIRLRGEYKDAAHMAAQADSSVGFDELASILDKIVEAKRRMRNLGCGEEKRNRKNNF